MGFWDIMIIIAVVVVAVIVGLYFLNRWASRKMGANQSVIEKTKVEESIFIIEKKRDNIKNVNVNKAVADAIPKFYKMMKMYFVLAKVGPRIVTLMCDKKVFGLLPVKKTARVELSGMYIVGIKGMKTDLQMKMAKKEKLEKERDRLKAEGKTAVQKGAKTKKAK